MVFESIVTDLMNRFLGDFIENLDHKQLNIGIWGGDVVLKNLQLKQSALKDLDLPVQLVYGQLGKLILKIPWKNLYSLPVEADIEDLYLLVAPNSAVSYDPIKQKKIELDTKKGELLKLEEARKQELEKNTPKADKSFTEKLVAQIINNVQIRIRNVHIRYEDRSTSTIPFAFGITLGGLEVHTTDADWNKAFLSEALSKVFKVAKLDGLAVYMNCNTQMFQSRPVDDYQKLFMDSIATSDSRPENFTYVLGPITSIAKLKLNMNPELDTPPFEIPKVDLSLEMEKLSVGITRAQYQRLIELADGMSAMTRGVPYRKFRPFNTPYKGNAKIWWKFAYESILETEIKRRKKYWSWENMLNHRNMCRLYAEAYRAKLISKKLPTDVQQCIDQYEECLDLFNLILIRNRVDLEVEKSGKLLKAEAQKGGWFSGWWGGSKTEDSTDKDKDILDQFKTAMTSEEKAKLYQAIGYHEGGVDLKLPEDYTALTMHFNLKMLEFCVCNEIINPADLSFGLKKVLSLQVCGVTAEIDQRPASSGLKVDLKMREFSVAGYKQNEFTPVIVKSILGQTSDSSLLDIKFEMNPLDKRCDQRVDVIAQPLQIVYDAETVIQLLQVFKVPSNANLSDLTDAAADKLSNFKERSATGIQYVIEKHTRLEVNVAIKPNYVIVPHGGKYIENKVPVMIVSLGSILLRTEPRREDTRDVAAMHVAGATSKDILREMMDQAYDKFNLNIDNIQILLTKSTNDWQEALTHGKITKLHILEPTSLQVNLALCVVGDDPRLPKTRINAKIPSIGVSVTEQKVLDALALAMSIPLPESETAPMLLNKDKESLLVASSMSLKRYLDERQTKPKKLENSQQRDISDEEITQYTDLEFGFELNEVSIKIFKDSEQIFSPTSLDETPTEEYASATGTMSTQGSVSNQGSLESIGLPKQLSLTIRQLEMSAVQRTYDIRVSMKLGAISMSQYYSPTTHPNEQKKITMIETPRYAETNDYLLSMFYTNANKNSPEFTSKYKSTEQLIEINFTILILNLHQEGLTEILQFANNFQTKMDAILNKSGVDRIASAGSPLETIDEGDEDADIENNVGIKSLKGISSRVSTIVDSIKIKLIAKMEQVSIGIENEKRPITNLKIQNMNASVIMKTSYTELNLKLQDIIVEDLNSETIHSTILTVVGGDALLCQIVLFNLEETAVYNDNDMKIDVSMGCVKIVFLNWFVTSVLNFLDNFQTAQQAIADASAAAAETAKQNMVEAYSNAKRMLLNIRIKAPIIIVPVDSRSLNAVSIDLGHLCITNMCSNIPNSSVNDRSPAVLDEMKLELKDMKISKVEVCKTSEEYDSDVSYGLRNDENILNPTSFALIIKRNLSSGWYKEIPELDISGRLKSIIINLLATDYQLLMSILSKNMTEGANERVIVTKKPGTVTTPTSTVQVHTYGDSDEMSVTTLNKEQRASKRTNRSSKISSKPKIRESDILPTSEDDGENAAASKKKKIDTFLQFTFQMDSIILNLYTTRNEGLASFGIHFLSLKGCKLADGSMNASIVLCDVQLDDIRPNRQNFITKFMKKKEIDETLNSSSEPTAVIQTSSSSSMVDIVIRIKEDETFANLKVSSFDLILSLEFLLKLAQFVSVPQDLLAKPIGSNNTTSSSSKASEVAPVVETDPNKKMTVLINIEQPDIILVEAMDDINCLALILNTQMALRVRMQGERQVIEGEIADLKFYLCEYNPSRRNATKHFIIQPCTLSLHGNTPESNGMNISLSTSDIRINISPAIIEIVNKAVSTVTTTETTAEKDIVEELPDCTDLWEIKKYTEDDFWFMKVEEAEEVLVNDYQPISERKSEVCIVDVPSIVIVIETGFGYYTYPMLVIETKLNAQIRNWSSEISIESSLSLGMAFYNSMLAVWEPLIEPNEREKSDGLTEYQPWELNFSLKIEKPAESSLTESEPKTKVTISSSDTLEMSMTKTCLDVLQDLGQAFSDAIRPQGLNKPDVIAPYIIENDTGFDIIMNLSKGSLNLHSSHLPNPDGSHNDSLVVFNTTTTELDPNQIITCKISPGGRAYLQPKREHSLSKITAFCTNEQSKHQETLLNIQIGDIDKEITLPIHKADRRYFPLYRDTNQEPWGIISHVHTEYGSTVITIHGVLKVKNHFSTAVSIFRKRNGNLIEIGRVDPDSTFNIPLHALYASQKELFFSVANYKTSVQGFNWKENPSDFKYMKYLQCDPINTFEPFYITAIREREEVYHEVTSKYTMLSVCYVINLKPPLYLRNALPIDIQISVAGCTVSQNESIPSNEIVDNSQHCIDYKGPLNVSLTKSDFLDYGEKVVKPGDLLHLPTVKTTAKEGERRSLLVARLVQYLEKDWSCTTEIPANPPEFAVWSFNSYDSDEMMSIELGVKFDNLSGSLQLTVYCPFWMINKTDLMLSYRSTDENANVLYHPPKLEGPILFSYREKVFFGKKRAAVRVENGDWSEKFALDAAGSTGLVECKAAGVTYEIAVHNTLTHNSLTKQITFMPFYVVINKAPFTIQVQENKRPGDPWLIVNPEQCVPLWPKSDGKTLHVRAGNDETVSRPFKFIDPQCTLLKLKNRYGGINVDVQVSEGGAYITFSAYHPGDAPALIINHTSEAVKFWEKGNVNERCLKPFEKMLYTWQDPAGDRIILWGEGDDTVENDLRRDGINPMKRTNNDIQSYWVSFLDGTQRVLLFTNDYNIAYGASSASRLDKVSQEIEVDIHGIGLSLVNNIKQCDIMYIGIASSGVIWEEKKKSRYFKQMKIQEVQILEDRYQQYLRNRQVGINDHNLYFDSASKVAIDFDNMILRKSNIREIRRTFYPGLWINLKSSPYQLQLHAKINRIQIDNQLADCIFPVVLAPVAPPKSVAASIELKPFIECSIVQRIIPHSNVKQFKYLRVLTQEFHVKVDLLFINEIAGMFTTELTDEEKRKFFNKDISQHREPLSALVLTQSNQDQKNFYDQLHLGPLKIHISFSMAGLEPGALPTVLSTILQGVGVTLTDINDIVFRLTFFEREYNFFTQKQLTSEIVSHYTNQAVKQAYVLILGLDVIGNPYGLVVGFTKGVEDLFYEPFQGAIQGPSEFAEGLVLGVRSLFGHTVGGAAGAVSKITGAMGKGLAALTFDKDYQKKRREQMNKKPANLHEGLARSGQGLVMGVVDGVTGVLTQPISGARNDGFEGFFKGLGKGAVGLIARPTAGLVDFASGSFDAVKRATEMSEEVNRLRPPRSLHSDGILRPFCLREAEGNKLLKEIEKGKYASSDIFAHFEVIYDKREVLLLSDHRVMYCEKNELFGGWQISWSYRWNEIHMLRAVNRGIELLIGEKSKKVLGLFGSNEQKKKLITIPQMARRDRLLKIMNELKSNEP